MPTQETTERADRKAHTAHAKAPKTYQPLDPSLFVHAPRAAEASNDQYNWQRRFGGGHFVIEKHDKTYRTNTMIEVFRDAKKDTTELTVTLCSQGMFKIESQVDLTADELQALACALLDAAHDLRSHLGKDYVPGGAV